MTPKIPVVGFVATSGSGKTTLLRRVVPLLVARGLRVGYLKHAHHGFDLDMPGKDSYELREAGAVQTLLASDERWALQAEHSTRGRDPDLAEMLAHFDATNLDLVLVEGFKHATYPKIEVHRRALGRPPLYQDDGDIIAVASDVAPAAGARSQPRPLPIDDPSAVADFIVRCLQTGVLHLPGPPAGG
jgi:molybdopterin-guanine dinucleotide biosynthesis adapter protein